MSLISPNELKKLISENPGLTIIDIRSPEEISSGVIPNSKWMDVTSKSFMNDVTLLPKDKTYCVYCASGGRSSMVVPFMEMNGFTKVYELEGGIMAWENDGNTLVLPKEDK